MLGLSRARCSADYADCGCGYGEYGHGSYGCRHSRTAQNLREPAARSAFGSESVCLGKSSPLGIHVVFGRGVQDIGRAAHHIVEFACRRVGEQLVELFVGDTSGISRSLDQPLDIVVHLAGNLVRNKVIA